MAEVTRVPIQPVAKGSLTKIWLGVIVAMLIGAGLAWAAVPKSFSVDTLVAGEGDFAKDGDMVFVKYKGTLAATGETFDEIAGHSNPGRRHLPEGSPFPVEEGATIPGSTKAFSRCRRAASTNSISRPTSPMGPSRLPVRRSRLMQT